MPPVLRTQDPVSPSMRTPDAVTPSLETQDVDSPAGNAFHIRSRRRIHLGPVRIDIRSNEPEFKGFRFFPQPLASEVSDAADGDEPDFALSLCNLNIDGPWPLPALESMRDVSYRAKRMSAGYYLTDHFGPPAYLVVRGHHYWIFAVDFEPILWPYAVKHLLTLYAIEHNMLHLKAAAVAIGGRGALLIGRGGSGKTVLLSRLCGAGAQFLSNTHVLMDGQSLLGIRTNMRVRADEFFAPIIAARGLSAAVKAGEYTADPLSDLGWPSARSAPIRSVCLIDYKGTNRRTLQEIDRDTVFDYMEQFSLALNVYGLKEDILDALGGDIHRFSVEMSRMKTSLRELVNGSRCYYLSCDAADPQNLRAICALLEGSSGPV
jgi:hypothetical protein